MRSIRLLRHLLPGLAASFALTLAAAADGVHLVHARPGGYPYESKVDYPAGDYFALHCTDGCALKKDRVRVLPQAVETTEGRVPGYVLRAGSPSSLFLVRGIPGLKEGPLRTWYLDKRFGNAQAPFVDDKPWTASQQRRFDIDGAPLEVKGVYSSTADPACQDCSPHLRVAWEVRHGGMMRTLAVVETGAPELGTPLTLEDFVVWIGDLDGDGRPDLVVRPQERGDYLHLQLFLSSELAPGKPWRPAATFYFWDPARYGC